MANSSTPPLLAPPPSDLSNHSAVRTWMNNIYVFLFQQNFLLTAPNITALNAAITTINGQITTINTSITSINSSITTLNTTTAGHTTSINALNAGTAGTWTLLSTTALSNSASLSLPTAFSGIYTQYKIIIKDLFSVTSAGIPQINFSTDGSTFDVTAGHYAGQQTSSTGATVTSAGGSAASIVLTISTNLGTSATTAMSGEYLITNPKTTTGYCKLIGNSTLATGSTAIEHDNVSGHYNQTGTSVKGFRLNGSAGNLTGSVSVYGILQ